ncbi:MAG TPA: HEPN domain-containing protein [Chloroflexi bacterium]|nr:HEPN domain-containing protein [Chloroflexota bacterium]
MLKDPFPTPDTICFHSQQCMEKLLKGFLTARGQDIVFTHDLPHLMTLCIELDERFSKWMNAARELTDYAVEVRYPDDWRDIPLEEAANATEIAKQFRNFVSELMKEIDTTTSEEDNNS